MGWESGIQEDRRELDADADMYVPLVAKCAVLANDNF